MGLGLWRHTNNFLKKGFCCTKVIKKMNQYMYVSVIVLTQRIKLSRFFYSMVNSMNLKPQKTNGRMAGFFQFLPERVNQ